MVSGERGKLVATDLGLPEPVREADEPVAARLKKRYGAEVDPGISLQEQPTGDELEPVAGPSSQILNRLEAHGLKQTRYRLKGEIARGGMGAILKVWDEDLRRNIAMKVVLGESERDEHAEVAEIDPLTLGRFLEEAQVTGQLDHPGIVPVHELGLDDAGHVYFTMRLVKGRDLRTIFDLVHEGEEGWSVTRALGVLLKVCEAMSYAHAKGVIHRDLKPSNVMVGRFGEVYVMDWGLARVVGQEDRHEQRLKMDLATGTVDTDREREVESESDDALRTMEGTVVGTPVYMSPEQARGETTELDARADVYAVGAMLYHLLTGQMPYVPSGARIPPRLILFRVLDDPPKPLSKLDPEVPAELVAITEKAMSRERSQRYADMSELAEDLRAYLEHRVVGAYRTGAIAELGKWVERNKVLATIAAAAALVLVLTTVLYVAGIAQARTEAEEALVRTRALGLASASYEVLDTDATLSLLLAREAVRVDQTPETLSRLHQAVGAVRERAVFRHTAALVDAVFSPTGDKLLGISRGEALLWDRKGKLLARLIHPSQHWLLSACFSPSGDYLLTSSQDKNARLWDRMGRELASYEHDDLVWTSAFSPDERYLVTASQDGTAKLWKRDHDGAPLAVLGGHAGAVRSASFSPDGTHILTASMDATGRLWRFFEEDGTATLLAELVGHEGPITSAVFSPAGDRIVTASGLGFWQSRGVSDETARVWDLAGNRLAVLEGHTGGVERAIFSPSGDEVLTASLDGTGRLWDLEGTALTVYRIPSSGMIWGCSFSPDGKLVSFGCEDGSAWLFGIAGNPIGSLSGHGNYVCSVRFSPDSRSIATASGDGTVRLWSVLEETVPTLHGHRSRVENAVYSPDGNRIATASADGTARVWDTLGNELAVLRGHREAVHTIAFSPDGLRLVTASSDVAARLWDLDGNALGVLEHDPEVEGVYCASFSPDGKRIATGCVDGTVWVWGAEGEEAPDRYETAGNFIYHVAFTPDRRQLLICRNIGPVLLLTLEDRSIRSLEYAGVHGVFSPVGDEVLLACEDGSAVRLNLEGELLKEFPGHESRLTWASFSGSGQWIVTASQDGTARIWEADGPLRATLRGHAGKVTSAVFSPSEGHVLTASSDGTARTWLVDADELIELAARRSVRNFSPGELLSYEELLDVPALEAQRLVEELSRELLLREEVIARIQEERDLDSRLRETALRFAGALVDSPEALFERAWTIVSARDNALDEYARALRYAEAAYELLPSTQSHLHAIAVAQYRAEQLDDSIATLTRCDELNRSRSEPGNPAGDLLFLAMAHCRLGDSEKAEELLAECRLLMADETDPALHGFLREAEELIEGAGGP